MLPNFRLWAICYPPLVGLIITNCSTDGEGFTLSLTIGTIVVLFMLLATLLNARVQSPLNLLPNDSEASIEAVIEADAEMADAIDAILVEQPSKGKKSD